MNFLKSLRSMDHAKRLENSQRQSFPEDPSEPTQGNELSRTKSRDVRASDGHPEAHLAQGVRYSFMNTLSGGETVRQQLQETLRAYEDLQAQMSATIKDHEAMRGPFIHEISHDPFLGSMVTNCPSLDHSETRKYYQLSSYHHQR
jgi:hypothetical protein